MSTVSIAQFIRVINTLPSDKPKITPGRWYTTQKQHWLGWLKYYHGPGGYGRKSATRRDAEFAYNHIVNYLMLLWIIEAAGVDPKLVKTARRNSATGKTLQQKAAAVRNIVPWDVLYCVLYQKRA